MTNEKRKRLGASVARLRGSYGLSQSQMAGILKCSQQGLSRWECGRIPRSWAYLARLHKEFGVDLNRLLAGEK